jgi:hypothetical protein
MTVIEAAQPKLGNEAVLLLGHEYESRSAMVDNRHRYGLHQYQNFLFAQLYLSKVIASANKDNPYHLQDSSIKGNSSSSSGLPRSEGW